MDVQAYQTKLCEYCEYRAKQACDLDCHVYQKHPEHFNTDLTGDGGAFQGNTKQISTLLNYKESDFDFVKGSYFEDYLSDYYLDANDFAFKFPTDLISYQYDNIIHILEKELQEKRQFKLFMYINVTFSKYEIQSDSIIYTEPPVTFRTYNHTILHQTMINKILNTGNKKLEAQVENFLMNQSGWSVHCINDLTIRILRLRQIKGGSYIPLPLDLLAKEKSGALLNINNSETNKDNDDEKCFLWCCLAKLFPVIGKNRNRSNRLVKTYKKKEMMSKLNVSNINFPMTLSQIPQFLEDNRQISLTIFGYNVGNENASFQTNHSKSNWRNYIDKQRSMLQNLYPLYISPVKKEICIELLLLIDDRDKHQVKSHFVLITDLNKFLRNSNKNKQRICTLCLQNFNSQSTFDHHTELCQSEKGSSRFPKKKYLFFEQLEKTQLVPYFYTLDFEAALEKVNISSGQSVKLQYHHPVAYCWQCISHDGRLTKSVTYLQQTDDDDVTTKVITELLEDAKIRLKKSIVTKKWQKKQ